jgi:DNA-binding response OmpR family regulator
MTGATKPVDGDSRVTVFCPECGRRYALTAATLADPALKMVCGNCESVFVPGQRPSPPAAAVPQPRLQRATVVVAHESPAVCATVGRVLEEAGFAARYVHDGARAVAAFDASMPDQPVALVLDVGVPEVMAFQVVHILRDRAHTRALKIILLASVFERTRYKRRPTSLHGADGYVELHHVPDRLGVMLKDLLGARESAPPRTHLPVERAVAESLRPDTQPVTDVEAARVLARRLVSDVALYHEGAMGRGLANGGVLKEAEVQAALAEARAMFVQRVTGLGDQALRVFEEAMEELVTGLAAGRDPGARQA